MSFNVENKDQLGKSSVPKPPAGGWALPEFDPHWQQHNTPQSLDSDEAIVLHSLAGSIPELILDDQKPTHPALWAPGINHQHGHARGLRFAFPLWEGSGYTITDLVGGLTMDATGTDAPGGVTWVQTEIGTALRLDGICYFIHDPDDRFNIDAYDSPEKCFAQSVWWKVPVDYPFHEDYINARYMGNRTVPVIDAGGTICNLAWGSGLNPTLTFGEENLRGTTYDETAGGVSPGHPDTPLPNNTWTHVFFQYYQTTPDDDWTLELYINGGFIDSFHYPSSSEGPVSPPTGYLYLGSQSIADDDGTILGGEELPIPIMYRDWRVYDRRFYAHEVQDLYTQPDALYEHPSATRLRYARISETYNETMSGGVLAGGSASVSLEVMVSGGVVCGGTSTVTVINLASITGGVVCGGSALVTGITNITATGGAVIGGPRYANGFLYRRLLTVDPTRTLTGFPHPISVAVLPNMNSFRAETIAGVMLPMEVVDYNSTTGRLFAFVKLDLSEATATSLYLYYGGA